MKNKLFLFKPSRRGVQVLAALLVSFTFFGCLKNDHGPGNSSAGIKKVNHVVVIYLENHSFDNLYGQFYGANGLQNANPGNTTQLDATGAAYNFLPPIPGTPAFPTNLPNTIFNILCLMQDGTAISIVLFLIQHR